jgi:hypothetical protein
MHCEAEHTGRCKDDPGPCPVCKGILEPHVSADAKCEDCEALIEFKTANPFKPFRFQLWESRDPGDKERHKVIDTKTLVDGEPKRVGHFFDLADAQRRANLLNAVFTTDHKEGS